VIAVQVRTLRYRDLRTVVEIERDAFGTPWPWWEFAFELSKPSSICLAAVDAEGLAGYLVCSRQDRLWHMRNVAVRPARRRRGIGSALVQALLERIDPECGLVLEVRESDGAALAMYERFGFRPAGRRPAFYGDNREDALIMWLSRSLA
jgi:ribosomal-protein-alanine N-acetyltransferase